MARIESQPFDDKDVLFWFVPSEEEDCEAEEYLVVRGRRLSEPSMLAYRRIGKDYYEARQNYISACVIARLLSDLAGVKAERDEWRKRYETLKRESDARKTGQCRGAGD